MTKIHSKNYIYKYNDNEHISDEYIYKYSNNKIFKLLHLLTITNMLFQLYFDIMTLVKNKTLFDIIYII